ncbi:hypothetical protein EDB87DRAFT_1577267 [Lactarius vividus]|nr:hypothetical protein EDB87DRAFT_1577267 [Lactarius vividus]
MALRQEPPEERRLGGPHGQSVEIAGGERDPIRHWKTVTNDAPSSSRAVRASGQESNSDGENAAHEKQVGDPVGSYRPAAFHLTGRRRQKERDTAVIDRRFAQEESQGVKLKTPTLAEHGMFGPAPRLGDSTSAVPPRTPHAPSRPTKNLLQAPPHRVLSPRPALRPPAYDREFYRERKEAKGEAEAQMRCPRLVAGTRELPIQPSFCLEPGGHRPRQSCRVGGGLEDAPTTAHNRFGNQQAILSDMVRSTRLHVPF